MSLSKKEKSGRIMLIDDNTIDHFLVKMIFRKTGFIHEVNCFDVASDALMFLSDVKNADALPDIIFLDINMPVMNGFDFLEEFTRLPDTVKKKSGIVMLTSSLIESDMEKANTNPYVRLFLNKPLTEEKITLAFVAIQ